MAEPHIGEFELLVILAALRLGPKDAYTVTISQVIADRTGRRAGRGTVYATLQRLEEKGWVRTRLGAPRPKQGGKARRLVTVAPEGVEAVRQAADGIRAMCDGLDEPLGDLADLSVPARPRRRGSRSRAQEGAGAGS